MSFQGIGLRWDERSMNSCSSGMASTAEDLGIILQRRKGHVCFEIAGSYQGSDSYGTRNEGD